ncbi:MAG: FAD-dependent monooxygenase [Pseudomonadota bacterium]
MDLSTKKIAIVGGGVAGLASALGLVQRGAEVTLYEQAPAITEVGAGLQISPNGHKVIADLGLTEALDAVSLPGLATQLFDHKARMVVQVDLPTSGYRYVHRAKLIEILEQAYRGAGGSVQTGLFVRHIDVRTGQLHFMDELGDSLGTSPSYDFVLAATGLKSLARDQINQGADPRFSKQVAWRAVIEETGQPTPEGAVYMGPGRHIVSYPLAAGLRNLVAVEARGTWTEDGWSHQGDLDAFRAAFADFEGPVPGWLEAVKQVHCWGLFLRPVAQRWFEGRMALLGDAAHPTLPFLAQGANLALEDAWMIRRALEHDPHYGEAFARFEAARKPRVARVIKMAGQNARNFHFGWPLQGPAHAVLKAAHKLRPDALARRLAPIYDYDVTRF